ncbi:hypothetical protein BH09BAC2_BH09BAC2_04010 [soil metagenome]
MTYTWQFAPDSFINIVWKNSAFDFEQQTIRSYFNNFKHTIETPQNNSFSIKILYYLDYLRLKSKKAV